MRFAPFPARIACSPQSELERNGRTVIQQNRVYVPIPSRQMVGAQIEYPCLTVRVPAEATVRCNRADALVNVCDRTRNNLDQIETGHHPGSSDVSGGPAAY